MVTLPDGLNPKNLVIYDMPHPSNISSKPNIRLFVTDSNEIYQLQSHTFSKSRPYHMDSDISSGKYNYTEKGEPIASLCLRSINLQDQSYLIPNSNMLLHNKYDLTYSLIGYHFQASRTENEEEYLKISKAKPSNVPAHFLTLRDYFELLTEKHSTNWQHFPLPIIEKALAKISDTVEEAGDTYIKISDEKVRDFLLEKVLRLTADLPESIPVPSHLDHDTRQAIKNVMATNLLISLIPKAAYDIVKDFEGTDTYSINLKGSFETYKRFQQERQKKSLEMDLLEQSLANANSSGISKSTSSTKKVNKKNPAVKKVAVGKGAIDMMFKRQK